MTNQTLTQVTHLSGHRTDLPSLTLAVHKLVEKHPKLRLSLSEDFEYLFWSENPFSPVTESVVEGAEEDLKKEIYRILKLGVDMI